MHLSNREEFCATLSPISLEKPLSLSQVQLFSLQGIQGQAAGQERLRGRGDVQKVGRQRPVVGHQRPEIVGGGPGERGERGDVERGGFAEDARVANQRNARAACCKRMTIVRKNR